jgi:hypothetical protein
MKGSRPLKAVGWLGSMGYMTVVDKPAQEAALAIKKQTSKDSAVLKQTIKPPKDRK